MIRNSTPHRMKFDAHKIAIVKLGAIGDVVNSLPFVNKLRAAHEREC